MRKNQALAKLRAGEPTAGLWLNIPSPLIAEFGAHAGFDWILLDAQHGYWSYDSLLAAIQVISATETVPLVRALWNDPALLGQLLDAGALGIVVPMVNSAEEATRAAAAMRYPPYGQRSIGGGRLRFYGSDYIAAANDEVLCAVMIETRQGAERAAEILSAPGVDLGFIGPVDLARSMGIATGSEEHEAIIRRILAAGQAHGTPVGIFCLHAEEAIHRAEQGFQFMPCALDLAILTSGMSAAVERWRSR